MKRPAPELPFTDELFTFGPNALTVEQKLEHIQLFRDSDDLSCQLDRVMMERLAAMHLGLEEAKESHRKMKALIDKLCAVPWFPATYIQEVATPEGTKALVQLGNARRIVGIADGVDRAALGVGAEVFLSNEGNVIVAKSPNGVPRGGETALFERKTADGRFVLKYHEDEIILDPAMALKDVVFRAGDQVRCDRGAWIAFERIERSKGDQFFLEETPDVSFQQIGGLGPQIERIQRAINLHLFHAEVVRKYGARRKGSILFVGPPGGGKTMLAKAVANYVGTLSPSRRSRFINIKPSGWNSIWYGQSEANIREVFRAAREAAIAEPGVPTIIFIDELDSIGSTRATSPNSHIDDKVMLALAAELDGLTDRGNILVIGATNRRDSLDPALLRPGRFGDLLLEVPRPKMKAAHEIFTVYLKLDIPYARNGHGDDLAATREEIIASVLSRIYSPNGESELATLVFRDGKRRAVRAAELISGAVIANIVSAAIERACVREVETGESGLRAEDVYGALAEEFEASARVLTPRNCRHHLSDLPQDMDVVSVEPIVRKVKEPHRYLNPENP